MYPKTYRRDQDVFITRSNKQSCPGDLLDRYIRNANITINDSDIYHTLHVSNSTVTSRTLHQVLITHPLSFLLVRLLPTPLEHHTSVYILLSLSNWLTVQAHICSKWICFTLHYITLHYVTLRYVTLRYVTLRYVTLHYIKILINNS
jgi:hypothetical protein